jgi:hypothetical protein
MTTDVNDLDDGANLAGLSHSICKIELESPRESYSLVNRITI